MEFLKIEKLAQSHVEGIGDPVQSPHFGIVAPAVDDIVDCGLLEATECGQAVDRHALLFAQTPYSVGIDIRIHHPLKERLPEIIDCSA